MLESQKKIIYALGIKNGQTFTELLKNADTNRDSLAKGLKELKPHLKQENNLYSLKSETKNKTLLAFKKSNVMNTNFEEAMKELEEHGTPFELGLILIQTISYDMSQLTIQQHAPHVSEIERLEFERLIAYCNKVINGVFDVLWKKDPKQTEEVRRSLQIASIPPHYSFILNNQDKLNRTQRRKAERLIKDIRPHVRLIK